MLALALLLTTAGGAAALAAGETDAKLQELERALSAARTQEAQLEAEARAQAAQLTTLEQESIRLAGQIQAREEALTEAEAKLRALDARAAAKQAALADRHVELARLTTSLHRLARQPAEAALVAPGSPTDTVRGGMLLRAALPRLVDDAEALRLELAELGQAWAALDRQRIEQADAAQMLARDRLALAEVIAQRSVLLATARDAAQEASQQTRRLALQSRDLRELVVRLAHARAKAAARARAQEPQKPERDSSVPRGSAATAVSLPRFGDGEGRLIPPVRGAIVLGYGQTDQFGLPHKGLTIAARPEAQVVAPSAGQVAFAGPFRGYGQILILEHGEGYHTLMAGFSRIDGAVGQNVAAGEPLGTTVNPEEGAATFYVELRRNGQPIDPLPWLATLMQKVPG